MLPEGRNRGEKGLPGEEKGPNNQESKVTRVERKMNTQQSQSVTLDVVIQPPVTDTRFSLALLECWPSPAVTG